MATGFGGRHAGSQVLFGLAGDVFVHLLEESLLVGLPRKQVAEACGQPS